MKNDISVFSLSRTAWAEYCKDKFSWLLLSGGGIALMAVISLSTLYMQEYAFLIPLIVLFPNAIFTAILHKNGLDAAYDRKLSLFRMTPSILFASLFFIALSLYNPFPEELKILLLFPERFELWMVASLVANVVMLYLLVRCMFVGMIILEEKSKTLDAFHKSFALTKHHIFLLMGLLFFLVSIFSLGGLIIVGVMYVLQCIIPNYVELFGEFLDSTIILIASIFMIIGSCVILPYTILMKTLLYKKLNDMNK